MSGYRTMTIVLSDEEAAALYESATADLRKPAEQARYLLRVALGLSVACPPVIAPDAPGTEPAEVDA